MSAPGPGASARAALFLALGLGTAALAPGREGRPCPAAAGGGVGPDGFRELVCGSSGAVLAGPERLLFGLRLDPNRAEAAALEVLPGIGPRRASAWVRERERRPFCRPADLDRVPGIGPSGVRILGPWLDFPEDGGCHPTSELRAR